MAAIRSKNTQPEMLVRRLVYSLGCRYRLHRKDLPGKPDLVFASRRKAIFVHGCFWHCHGCKISHAPKSNRAYWCPKLIRNQERDAVHLQELRARGWQVLVLWECELKDKKRWIQRIQRFLSPNPKISPSARERESLQPGAPQPSKARSCSAAPRPHA